jgi:hypothetical protein
VSSIAHKVSNNGIVVGESAGKYGLDPIMWSAQTGLQPVSTVQKYTSAIDISADGQSVLMKGIENSKQQSYLVAQGQIKKITNPTDTNAMIVARDLSSDGKTVVGGVRASNSTIEYGFVWNSSSGMKVISVAKDNSFVAVNANGTKAVTGNSNWEKHNGTFITWTKSGGAISTQIGKMVRLDTMSENGDYFMGNGKYTDNFAWSAQGEVHFGYNFFAADATYDGKKIIGNNNVISVPGTNPIIWDPINGLRDLQSLLEADHNIDLSGWSNITARGISDNGNYIVGSGTNPQGKTEGWVISIVPECEGDL